jgi:hypothetical protein
MLKLMSNDGFGESEAVAEASQWANRAYLRHAATLVAWLTALMAFSLMGKHVG